MSQKETFLLPDGRKTSDLKVTELKKELDKLGKSKSGNKMELINRLNESYSSNLDTMSQIEKENPEYSQSQDEVSDDINQLSYHENQDELDESSQNDRRVINIKKSFDISVDLDASDDTQPDNTDLNQSDALDLYVPMDDSLNPVDETIPEERIQITISRNNDVELNCDDVDNDRRIIESMPKDERTVICGHNDSEKEEGIDMECVVYDSSMKDIGKSDTQSTLKRKLLNDKMESEAIENEADEMENIELETQIEMYEVDNIDMDGQIEMYDETNKDDILVQKIENKPDDSSVSIINSGVGIKDRDGMESRDTTGIDETEEGEVVSVPITARLGKRKVKDDSKTHTSPKKQKKKGLKETKGAGYIVEGPERIQPAQKSKNIISDVLRVDNLVRPFTLVQLQDMLATQGFVKEIWLNKIKSVAYVRYESESVAISARENIDGCRWPSINPKLLACDFVFSKEMEWMKEKGDSGVNPPSFKPQQYQTSQNQEQAKPVPENDWRSVDKVKPTNVHGNRDNFKSDTLHNVHNSNHSINNKIGDDLKKRQKDHREVQDNRRRRTPQNPNEHRRRHESPKDKPRERERVERIREKSKEKVPPAAKLLEDIFRKTVTQPAIYWLPVAKEKKEESIKKAKEPVRVL